MQLVKDIMSKNRDRYEYVQLYLTMIDKAENNLSENPDIAIECCKSLVEGFSKFILKNINRSANLEHLQGMKYKPACEKCFNELAKYDPCFESEYVSNFVKFLTDLRDIRNKRGDVSHGKFYPKSLYSEPSFSYLIFCLTEDIIFYMLDVFFSIDLAPLKYEDNNEFNDMLDSEVEFVLGDSFDLGIVRYSKALFTQDNVDYGQKLQSFISDREDQEELDNEQ